MSRTANAISRLRKALGETIIALDKMSEVLEDPEPFYFELFKERERRAKLLDQEYVESWERELELRQKRDDDPSLEGEFNAARQKMTDILNKLYPSKAPDES